ncbi:MAG TPA: GNAT family N-acetyltransferase [Aggregatilineaceae bacterium]|nr:GNAT family N-acetyltransferase [Aggregatilineaceae bacterium]
MNITRLTDESLFNQLRDEWIELLADSSADEIFMTWEWQSIWWYSYQPGHLWVLAVRDDAGRLQGIAPWFFCAEDGVRRISAIGCVDVTDYMEVIARRGFETQVFDALAQYLAEHRTDYDELSLCNIPENSASHTHLPQSLQKRGFSVSLSVDEVCPIITLPDEFNDYIASLDKKNRHELRRKLRRALGGLEQVEWYVVGSEHDLMAELACFIHLMGISSADKATFLRDPQNFTFFKHIVPVMAEKGWLQLAFLTVNGERAAAYLNFDYNNRVLVYNSGLEPSAFGHLSPGIVLLARLIEHAIREKREVFDFLRGNESYKYDMGGKDTYVYRLVAQQN